MNNNEKKQIANSAYYAEEIRQLRQKANRLYEQAGQWQDHRLCKLADKLYKKATWYEKQHA